MSEQVFQWIAKTLDSPNMGNCVAFAIVWFSVYIPLSWLFWEILETAIWTKEMKSDIRQTERRKPSRMEQSNNIRSQRETHD